MGCENLTPIIPQTGQRNKHQLGDIEFDRCPSSVIFRNRDNAEKILAWNRLYAHYDKGHLAESGGVNAQPYKYIRAMELIKNEYAMIEGEAIKKAEANAKGK